MKMKCVFTALAFGALACFAGQEPAPSRAWVRSYVATNTAGSAIQYTRVVSNGVVTITGAVGSDVVTITGEVHDHLALVVTNATPVAVSQGVTNKMLFAWTGAGAFTNAPAMKAVFSDSTNRLVYAGVGSSRTNGCEWFEGLFGVLGKKITKSEAVGLGGVE